MNVQQPATSPPQIVKVNETNKVATDQHVYEQHIESYITFCAAGGLSTDDDGKIEAMTIEMFAAKIGVARQTLWRWKQKTANFDERVDAQRKVIFSKSRIAKIWNGLYLKAARGDVQAATMILTHFSDYTPPAQKVEHEVTGGLADLVQLMRARKIAENKVQVLDVANDSSTDAAE